jgi:hypothetical protein
MKKFLDYYRLSNRHRHSWFNLKWRLFVVLLLALFMAIIKDYLTGGYASYVIFSPVTQSTAPFLNGVATTTLFYWFFVGIIVGAFTAWLIFEGEYALGMYKTVKRMEREALEAMGMEKTVAKPRKAAANAKKSRRN